MHCLLISLGSAETQRGEDAVSGSRMPTLVFAGAEVPEELLLVPQPASPAISAMAAPAIAAIRSDVRIGASFLIAAGNPVVRVVPTLAIEGRAAAVRCRRGQHPRRLLAGFHPAYRLAGMSNCVVGRPQSAPVAAPVPRAKESR